MSEKRDSRAVRRSRLFDERLAGCWDEFKWLYCELYGQTDHLNQLMDTARQMFIERRPALVKLDEAREKDPQWYRRADMVGMMLYTDLFGDTLAGVQSHLDYLRELKVRYLHLMPLLKMPAEHNDGGYAVSDFRQVDPRLGDNTQLEQLADACHRKGMSTCLDFIVNHTSDEHEWAVRAKQGDPEYQGRYMCFDNWDIPSQFEKTVPQVFPRTAPGNFIWCEQMGKHVLSTFNPYQWDMNYRNPVVFNEMAGNLLFLADLGVDIFRVDAVPYIWKQLGTTCRNLPQVHTIMRLLRILAKLVCPAVIFKGEVVMKPSEVAPYFGPVDKPECDVLYNVTTMVCIWNTLATRDVTLLKWQMETMNALPKQYTFVNYVRCHDDIGWGLDEDSVRYLGFDPLEHKKFLYHFYEGQFPGSFARGELYNYDPLTQDARSCGTAASLCGIQAALESGDGAALDMALARDLLIHGYILSLSGIPVLYSGDEIGQLNDYSYHNDPAKASDSRFLHRGRFSWQDAEKRKDPASVQGRMFGGLKKLIDLREKDPVFDADADVYTWDSGNPHTLVFSRVKDGRTLIAACNFSPDHEEVHAPLDGVWTDLVSGDVMQGSIGWMKPYQMRWLVKEEEQ